MKPAIPTVTVIALAMLGACAPAGTSGGTAGSSTAGSSTAANAPTPPATTPNPGDLSDFVGARGGQAEMGLQSRGYEAARTEGLTTYWYNAGTGDCAEIVTAEGRYKSVTPVSPGECTGGGAGQSGAPTAAQQACLRDVRNTTNNPDVTVLESSFSEAGTQVIVGVGPQRARWNCIAYADGTTAGIESLTDEGSL